MVGLLAKIAKQQQAEREGKNESSGETQANAEPAGAASNVDESKTPLPAEAFTLPSFAEETADESVDVSEFDTSDLEPMQKRVSQEEKSVRELDTESLLKGPEGVRELCDEVDRLINEDDMLSELKLPVVRKYMKDLFVTLKERPEFDSVLIDKDIRNVFIFLRSVRQEAIQVQQVKTAKRNTGAKSQGTKAAKSNAVSKALAGFDLGAVGQDFFAKRKADKRDG